MLCKCRSAKRVNDVVLEAEVFVNGYSKTFIFRCTINGSAFYFYFVRVGWCFVRK